MSKSASTKRIERQVRVQRYFRICFATESLHCSSSMHNKPTLWSTRPDLSVPLAAISPLFLEVDVTALHSWAKIQPPLVPWAPPICQQYLNWVLLRQNVVYSSWLLRTYKPQQHLTHILLKVHHTGVSLHLQYFRIALSYAQWHKKCISWLAPYK